MARQSINIYLAAVKSEYAAGHLFVFNYWNKIHTMRPHSAELQSNPSYLKPRFLNKTWSPKKKKAYPQMLDKENKDWPRAEIILEVVVKAAERALSPRIYQAPNRVTSVVCQRMIFEACDMQIWQEHTHHYPWGIPVGTLRPPAVKDGQWYQQQSCFCPLFQTPPDPCHFTTCIQVTLMMHCDYFFPQLG